MNEAIITFNGGEFSGLIDSRYDIEKYNSGCRRLENMIPRIYGPAERRPGTRYVENQYDSTGTFVRVIPFNFSSDISYCLEFGNLYIRPFSIITYGGERVYYEGDEIIDSGLAITSPYIAEDLSRIQCKRLGDTMWLIHPKYAQRKLVRTSIVPEFSLEIIPFTKGPFLLRNDLIDPNETDTAYMILASGYVMKDEKEGSSFTEAYSTRWLARTFQPTVDCDISGVTLYMCRSGTVGSPGTLTISIKNTTKSGNNYYPTGSDLASQTTDGDTLPYYAVADNGKYAGSEWREVEFSSSISLSKNTVYAIELKATSGDTSNRVTWIEELKSAQDEKDCLVVSTNGGSSWLPTDDGHGRGGSSHPLYRLSGTGTVSGITGEPVSMTCQDSDENAISYFEDGHINTLFKLTYPREDKVSRGVWIKGSAVPYVLCDPIDVKGAFHAGTSGNWRATVELQRNENSAGWETVEIWVSEKDNQGSIAKVEDADNVQYRMIVTQFVHSDPKLRGHITVSNSLQNTIVQVNSIYSSSEVIATVLSGDIITDATKRWSEGAWSKKRGFPTTVTFFEDRCIYSGMSDIQAQVVPGFVTDQYEPKLPKAWKSETGDYENFEVGEKNADSFALTIPSANDISWAESLESLIVGTSGDEWRIGSNKMEQPITPTNYSVRQQSSYGNKNLQAVKINDQILFVDSVGRKVREFAYNGEKYVALNLTSLAEHITKSGIVWMAYQRNPDSILWCGLDNGSLIAMVFEKAEKVIAWSKMPVDGQVQSGCVTTGVGEDDVWLTVKRNIAGTDYIFIEKMASREFDYIEDAYFLDCGMTYCNADKVTYEDEDLTYEDRIVMLGTSFTSIPNLSHLNGRTISILADGVEYTDIIVSSDSASLPSGVSALKAQAGIPYRYTLEPMKPIINTQAGSSMASVVSCNEMGISFHNTLNAQYGRSINSLFDINWDDAKWKNSSEIGGLFTGTVVVTLSGGFSIDNNLVISGNSPYPCTVRAMIPRINQVGR